MRERKREREKERERERDKPTEREKQSKMREISSSLFECNIFDRYAEYILTKEEEREKRGGEGKSGRERDEERGSSSMSFHSFSVLGANSDVSPNME